MKDYSSARITTNQKANYHELGICGHSCKKGFINTLILALLVLACVPARAYGSLSRAAYDSRGKRDPFIPLVGQQKQSISLEDVVSIEDATLEGVAVVKSGKKVAIINGVMLKEGDRVGNLEVKQIFTKKVAVILDGGEHELALPDETK